MPPRLAKLLAIVAALALIGGAFYFRSRNGASDGGIKLPKLNDSKISVVCITELADVCEQIGRGNKNVTVTTRPAGDVEKELVKADPSSPKFDAWVTFAPWPEMVDASRKSEGGEPMFGTTSMTTIGSATVGAVMDPERLAALKSVCKGADPSWACVAKQAGVEWSKIAPNAPLADSWGRFKVGVGDPDSGLGRLILGQVIQSVATDNKLPDNPGVDDFGSFLATIGAPVKSDSQAGVEDELTNLITQNKWSLVAVIKPAALKRLGTGQASQRGLEVVDFSPPARADVVIATLGTKQAGAAVKLFTDKNGTKSLTDAGWTPGNPQGSNGLPAADVLVALREKIG